MFPSLVDNNVQYAARARLSPPTNDKSHDCLNIEIRKAQRGCLIHVLFVCSSFKNSGKQLGLGDVPLSVNRLIIFKYFKQGQYIRDSSLNLR